VRDRRIGASSKPAETCRVRSSSSISTRRARRIRCALEDVNDYLRAVAGDDFSAKDFRTWEATMRCALERAAVHAEGMAEAKAAVSRPSKRVAESSAIRRPSAGRRTSPGVIAEFLAHGALTLAEKAARRSDAHALDRHERAVIDLIERIMAREREPLVRRLERSVRSARAQGKRAKG